MKFSNLKTTIIASLLLASAVGFAQNETILTLGSKSITTGEFERIYKKNNSQVRDEQESKTPSEYMEMFINFKLKVLEAERTGLDTTAAFRDELAMYRNELAQPYLTDISFTEATVKEAYYRTVNEVRASHILFRLSEDAIPSDTLLIWNKAIDVRNQFLSGSKTFAQLATEYSEDPSAARNQGDLGYFKAFQMVTPFEDAAYSTPVGEVSMPIHSRFGYHLVFVADKRASKGEIVVAHIMKMFSNPEHVSSDEENLLKAKADSIYQLILNGENFGELAQKYSDDKRTAVNGGQMQKFGAGQIDPDFSREAFALKNDNDVSPVIRTRYGFHIIKRIELKLPASFDSLKEELTEKVKNDPQKSKHNRSLFVDNLKKEYNFQYNQANLRSFMSVVGANKSDSISISGLKQHFDHVLFTFADQKYTAKQYLDWASDKENVLKSHILNSLNEFEEKVIIQYEDSKLESKYPDFKYLIQEYHDGILLFSIMEQKVWNKAIEDSLGLSNYYSQNRNLFPLGEHFDGLVIRCKSESARDSVEKLLSTQITDPKTIEDQMNQNGTTRVSIEKGRWEKGDNKIVDFYVWSSPKPEAFDETLQFIYGNKIKSGYKTLDEARGLYISSYQDYLEKEWLKELRLNNKIVINKKLLKKIKKA